jgi:hypothetical protein
MRSMISGADTPGHAQILTEDTEQATPDHLGDDIYTQPNLNLISTGTTPNSTHFNHLTI